MKISLSRLITIGLIVFSFALILLFPAGLGFRLFAPEGVSGFGFSGTVWNGRARIIRVADQELRNTEWDIAVFQLLIGRIAGDFTTRWADGFIDGFGSVSLGGTIRLTDTRAGFGAGILQSVFGIPRVGGQANMQLAELELQNNWPYRLVGNGELRNFSSPLMGQGEADIIGDIAFEFDTSTETDTATITGQLNDIGGPLELRGTLLLTPPGNYTMKARVKARAEAPEALQKNLEFLGPTEADGTRIFQLAGSI